MSRMIIPSEMQTYAIVSFKVMYTFWTTAVLWSTWKEDISGFEHRIQLLLVLNTLFHLFYILLALYRVC